MIKQVKCTRNDARRQHEYVDLLQAWRDSRMIREEYDPFDKKDATAFR